MAGFADAIETVDTLRSALAQGIGGPALRSLLGAAFASHPGALFRRYNGEPLIAAIFAQLAAARDATGLAFVAAAFRRVRALAPFAADARQYLLRFVEAEPEEVVPALFELYLGRPEIARIVKVCERQGVALGSWALGGLQYIEWRRYCVRHLKEAPQDVQMRIAARVAAEEQTTMRLSSEVRQKRHWTWETATAADLARLRVDSDLPPPDYAAWRRLLLADYGVRTAMAGVIAVYVAQDAYQDEALEALMALRKEVAPETFLHAVGQSCVALARKASTQEVVQPEVEGEDAEEAIEAVERPTAGLFTQRASQGVSGSQRELVASQRASGSQRAGSPPRPSRSQRTASYFDIMQGQNLLFLSLIESSKEGEPTSLHAARQFHVVAAALGRTPWQLCQPFWPWLAPAIVRSYQPRYVDWFCDAVLRVSRKDFLLRVAALVVPHLVCDGQAAVCAEIAAYRVAKVRRVYIDHAAAIIARLLMRSAPDVDHALAFAEERFVATDRTFRNVQFPAFLASWRVDVVYEILLLTCADNAPLAVGLINKVMDFAYVESPGESPEEVLQQTIFRLVVRFSETMRNLMGKQPQYTKLFALRGLQVLVEQVLTPRLLASVLRQLTAFLQATFENNALALAALQTWRSVVRKLEPAKLEGIVDLTIAIVNERCRVWDRECVDEARRVVQAIKERSGEFTKLHPRSVFEAPEDRPFKAVLQSLVERDTENAYLAVQTARDFCEFGLRYQQELTALDAEDSEAPDNEEGTVGTVGLTNDPGTTNDIGTAGVPRALLGRAIRVLLHLCAKDSNLVQTTSARALGLFGAVDPHRTPIDARQRRLVLAANFANETEVVEFCRALIGDWFLPAFEAAADPTVQRYFAYGIQELLKFMEAEQEARLRAIFRDDSLVSTLVPLLKTKYTLDLRFWNEVKYPIYAAHKPYGDWLAAFCSDLMRRTSHPEPATRVFAWCRKVLIGSHAGPEFWAFLLPYAALAAVVDKNDREANRQVFLREVLLVLSTPGLQPFHERVFAVVDYFNRWVAARRAAHEPLLAMEELIGGIPAGLMARRALEAKAYPRAVRYFEQQARETYAASHATSHATATGRTSGVASTTSAAAKATTQAKPTDTGTGGFTAPGGIGAGVPSGGTYGPVAAPGTGQAHGTGSVDASSAVGTEDTESILNSLRHIYAATQDTDALEGVSAQLPTLSVAEQALEYRATSQWASALACYSALPASDETLVAQLQCLQRSGREKDVLAELAGTRAPPPRLAPLGAECAWTVGDWEALERWTLLVDGGRHGVDLGPYEDDYAENDYIRDSFAFDSFGSGAGAPGDAIQALGSALEALRRQDFAAFQTSLDLAHRRAGERLGQYVATHSLTSLSPVRELLVFLHGLVDVESLGAVAATEAWTTASGNVETEKLGVVKDQLAQRLTVLSPLNEGPEFEARRFLLKLRGAALACVKPLFPFAEDLIAEGHLAASEAARDVGQSALALMESAAAKELGHPRADVARAQLLWARGESRSAIRTLRALIPGGFYQNPRRYAVGAAGADSAAVSTAGVLRGHSSDFGSASSVASLAFELTTWRDIAAQADSSTIVEHYTAILKATPSSGEAHYRLAKHYVKMHERSSAAAQANGVVAKHIVHHFTRALELGTPQAAEALPKMLTTWLDLGVLPPNASPQDLSSRKHCVAAANRDILHWGEVVDRRSIYTALPQLLSRAAHPLGSVRSLVRELVVLVVQQYPNHALWAVLAADDGSAGTDGSAGGAARAKQGSATGAAGGATGAGAGAGAGGAASASGSGGGIIRAALARSSKTNAAAFSSLAAKAAKLTYKLDKICRYDAKHRTSMQLGQFGESFRGVLRGDTLAVPVQRVMASLAHVAVLSIEDRVAIQPSMQWPKRVRVWGSDGLVYPLLLKGRDDVRKDARLLEFTGAVNALLAREPTAAARHLGILTYRVTPLSASSGIIEWVDGATPLRGIVSALSSTPRLGYDSPAARTMTNTAEPLNVRVQAFKELQRAVPPVLWEWFVAQFPDLPRWLEARTRYSRTLAVMSMVGFILGLGDRHLENILLLKRSGAVLHVDFDCLFDKGRHLSVPEIVPFRLTPQLCDALGFVNGYEGTFRKVCELTLKLIKANEDLLMVVLEAFIHDPVVQDRSMRLEPQAAMDTARAKIRGITDPNSVSLSVDGMVDELIHQATSPENLCQLFRGWHSWV